MSTMRNRVTLIGNLGQDPDFRTLDGGKKKASFTMATKDSFKNSEGQRISESTWHNIIAWNGLAETASKFLKKGNEVAVEGRICYRSYEDKNGVTKYITEIIVSDLALLRNGKTASKE